MTDRRIIKWDYSVTDANPVGDLFPSYEYEELPECPGGQECGNEECGYEPDECEFCYTAGHACWFECDHPICGLCRRDDIHDGHAAMCTEAGCPCASL